MSFTIGAPPALRGWLALGLGAALLAILLPAYAHAERGTDQAEGDPPQEAAPDDAGVMRWLTFEPGDAKPTTADELAEILQSPGPDRLSITEETARLGRYAGVALLAEGDPQYRGRLGYRAEWQSPFLADEGGEYWYGASYYLPPDWAQGHNPKTFDDRIVFQFHEGTGTPPTFSLHLDEERGRILVRHREPDGALDFLWSTRLVEERWYDFVFHVRWSRQDDGMFRVYLDGRLQYEYRGPTLNKARRIYTKWGIYGQPTRVIVDEVRIVEGPNGVDLAGPRPLAVLSGVVPVERSALLVFSGGSTEDLVAAAACSGAPRFWVLDDGGFVGYSASAPAFVNAPWHALFPDEVPRDTVVFARCG